MKHRLLLFFASLVASIAALAAGTTANVSWTVPATYTDGSALPASDIKNYTISWQHTAAGPVVGTLVVNAPATAAVVNVVCGDFVFTATITTTASALYPNATSGPSSPAPYVSGVSCKPNPPTGLTVS